MYDLAKKLFDQTDLAKLQGFYTRFVDAIQGLYNVYNEAKELNGIIDSDHILNSLTCDMDAVNRRLKELRITIQRPRHFEVICQITDRYRNWTFEEKAWKQTLCDAHDFVERVKSRYKKLGISDKFGHGYDIQWKINILLDGMVCGEIAQDGGMYSLSLCVCEKLEKTFKNLNAIDNYLKVISTQQPELSEKWNGMFDWNAE